MVEDGGTALTAAVIVGNCWSLGWHVPTAYFVVVASAGMLAEMKRHSRMDASLGWKLELMDLMVVLLGYVANLLLTSKSDVLGRIPSQNRKKLEFLGFLRIWVVGECLCWRIFPD
jgi:hypothetical protein